VYSGSRVVERAPAPAAARPAPKRRPLPKPSRRDEEELDWYLASLAGLGA